MAVLRITPGRSSVGVVTVGGGHSQNVRDSHVRRCDNGRSLADQLMYPANIMQYREVAMTWDDR
jgi:hypothetical protein